MYKDNYFHQNNRQIKFNITLIKKLIKFNIIKFNNMDILKNLTCNLQKDKYYYYNNGMFRLEYIENNSQWYLYDYKEKTYNTVFDIENFINTNKDILKDSKLVVEKTEKYIERLIKILGEFTFCTSFTVGWNICNSKIKLKIVIDKFGDIHNIKYTHDKTYISKDISSDELENFINSNIDNILYKDPINPNKNAINKNVINEDNKINENIDKKVDIDKLKKKLFIKLSKSKKMSYQSCLPYDENKIKLEKIYGIKLDLD